MESMHPATQPIIGIPHTSLEGKCLLYIDDDSDDREFLQDALQQRAPNLQLMMAVNGMEALSVLNRLKEGGDPFPDLIVLDLNMPYLNGQQTFEVLQESEQLRSIPLVVLTSSHHPGDRRWFQEKGIDVISKPDTMVHMDRIAQELLDRL